MAGSGSQRGWSTSTIQPNLSSWSPSFNFAVGSSDQYIYLPDCWASYQASGGSKYIIRCHSSSGSIESTSDGTTWALMSGLPSGAYWNSFVAVTINSKVNNDLVLWNNPTSKWVNLNSLTIYNKITVPITGVVDSTPTDVSSTSKHFDNTYKCFAYNLPYNQTYTLYTQTFSMPYDWVEQSAINVILHLIYNSPYIYAGASLEINYYLYNLVSGNTSLTTSTGNATNSYPPSAILWDFLILIPMTNVLTNWTITLAFSTNSGNTIVKDYAVSGVDIVYQSNCYGSSSITSKT